MKKKIIISFFVVLIILAVIVADWLIGYLALFKPAQDSLDDFIGNPTASSTIPVAEPAEYSVEEVITGLEVPWSIVWTDNDRMLIAERPGRIRRALNGQLIQEPLIAFNDVFNQGEAGLMGLVVDPDYGTNHYLYICYTYSQAGKINNKIVRLIDSENTAEVDKIILDKIPSAQFHAGCRLAFGPDEKLYISTGDATQKDSAQDKNSLAGKILRINSDGSIPDDNPFSGSPVWSFGHRNSQGLAWHPLTGDLYATEHGPSVFDGPAGGDEINRLIKGGNYGWPLVSHENRRQGTIPPLLVFTPAKAPASAAFISSKNIPQFTNSFFFGGLVGEGLFRVIFDQVNPDKAVFFEKLPEVNFGRIRAVAQGPDGNLYFSTSNRDGRGKPAPTDDRIFRIRPR